MSWIRITTKTGMVIDAPVKSIIAMLEGDKVIKVELIPEEVK